MDSPVGGVGGGGLLLSTSAARLAKTVSSANLTTASSLSHRSRPLVSTRSSATKGSTRDVVAVTGRRLKRPPADRPWERYLTNEPNDVAPKEEDEGEAIDWGSEPVLVPVSRPTGQQFGHKIRAMLGGGGGRGGEQLTLHELMQRELENFRSVFFPVPQTEISDAVEEPLVFSDGKILMPLEHWFRSFRSDDGVVFEIDQDYENGDMYSGSWRDNHPHGFGMMMEVEGDIYVGEWSKGLRNGHGVMTYEHGDSFEGEWQDGKYHGTGIYWFFHPEMEGNDATENLQSVSEVPELEADNANVWRKLANGRPMSAATGRTEFTGSTTFRSKHSEKIEGESGDDEEEDADVWVVDEAGGAEMEDDSAMTNADAQKISQICPASSRARPSKPKQDIEVELVSSDESHSHDEDDVAEEEGEDEATERDKEEAEYKLPPAMGPWLSNPDNWKPDAREYQGLGLTDVSLTPRSEASIHADNALDYDELTIARWPSQEPGYVPKGQEELNPMQHLKSSTAASRMNSTASAPPSRASIQAAAEANKSAKKADKSKDGSDKPAVLPSPPPKSRPSSASTTTSSSNVVLPNFSSGLTGNEQGRRRRSIVSTGSTLREKLVNPRHRYDGEWKWGKRHGKGFMMFENGEWYSGAWRKGMRFGQGLMSFKNGDFYEGGWFLNTIDGEGEMIWAKGDRYKGHWRYGKMHGKGVYKAADGTVTRGLWKEGELFQKQEKKVVSTPKGVSSRLYQPRTPKTPARNDLRS